MRGVLIRAQGPKAYETLSDSSGGFVIGHVVPGSYVIRLVRLGYDAVIDSLVVRQGYVDTLNYHIAYRSCP